MRQLKITSWLKYNIFMFLRNLCLFSVILWLLVFDFSMHEGKIAAVLSYSAVMLSVILIECDMIKINQFFACNVDIISKALILAGLPFVLSRFWNIAFYSICFGIMVQEMKWELESALINVDSSGSVEEIREDSKTNTFGSSKNEQEGNFQLQNVAQKKKANSLIELIKNEKLDGREQKITYAKELNETFREFPSSKKISESPDIGKIENLYKEKLKPYNEKHVTEMCTKCRIQMALKHKDFLKPKIDSNNDVIKNKVPAIVSRCGLKSHITNMNDLGLKKSPEASRDCKSDGTISEMKFINKEINEDAPEKLTAIIDKMLRLPENCKKMDSIINTTEYRSEQENTSKTVFPPVQVNASEVLDNENSSSNSDKKSSLHEDEIKNKLHLTTVPDFRDKTSLNSDFSDLDKVLQLEQNSERVKNTAAIEREEDLLKKSDFQSETLTGTSENTDSRNELETTNCLTENITFQPEAVCEYQIKYISEPNNDKNLTAVLKKHDSGSILKYEDPASEILQNSCTVSQHGKSFPIDKKPASNPEDQNKTKEFSMEKSENEVLTDINEISIVEDVVNRIDLGFIYALGFNNL